MKERISRIMNGPRSYLIFFKMRPFTTRYFFLLLCVLGLMWYAVYTNYIIGRLQKDAAISTQTYAELVRHLYADRKWTKNDELVFEKVVENFQIPIIITDKHWKPVMWRNIYVGSFFNRRELEQNDLSPVNYQLLDEKIKKLKKRYEPKSIYHIKTDEQIGYLVYGSSSIVSGLKWMPFYEAIFVIIFSAFVYFALSNVIVTEKSNLWVGLAKETAHQLGTPISSLMGWVEYMRTIREASDPVDPDVFINQIHDICDDMQKDLTRLKKITSRFSQIGSKPNLEPNNINEIITENVKYFRTRLPLLGKHIEIKTMLNDNIPLIPINRDLLEWVLENLFKNSVDAIQKIEGSIELKSEYLACDSKVRIHHIDNGKGISWDDQESIFSPGYTTKTRGWGLGLALAKRIVEDYHRGKIYVSWSQKGKGTAFCIDLPISVPQKAASSVL